ncbi:hypothetical protein DITRI_Ditri06bG0103800 [Diplodiscus trichospermus]
MSSFGSNSSNREDEGKRLLEQSFPAWPSKLDMLHHLEVKFDLPAGYRFFPSDDEMILDFLLNKIMGYELPLDIISQIDLYTSDPPLLIMSKCFLSSSLG